WPRPKAAAAPESTSGRARIALTAERGKTGRATSPMARTTAPSPSTTATAPRWRLSTVPPRRTSTSTGFAMPDLAPLARLLDPLEDRDVVGDGGAAHVEDAAELRALDLDAAGLAGQLHGRQHVHGHAGGADRMALGLQAAR